LPAAGRPFGSNRPGLSEVHKPNAILWRELDESTTSAVRLEDCGDLTRLVAEIVVHFLPALTKALPNLVEPRKFTLKTA
jgi:hypothetical protein